MRVTIEDENTIDRIISTVAKSEVQIRELGNMSQIWKIFSS